ncbi:MAG: hypothetical protein WB711_00345 [Terriglobales bacterium]
MKRCRRTMALGLAWIVLAWVTGCSRQLGAPGSNGSANGQLPFERVSDNSGLSPTDGFAAEVIPAGTKIAVRLKTAVSSAEARAGESFQAVLDEPLVVAGKTIVPQGTTVTGNVAAARASGDFDDPGYMRLTLASILVNGKSVPLRTSSIFAKGGSFDKRKPTPIKSSEIKTSAQPAVGDGGEISIHPATRDVRFSTGHRLSFRLAQPLQHLP